MKLFAIFSLILISTVIVIYVVSKFAAERKAKAAAQIKKTKKPSAKPRKPRAKKSTIVKK